MRKPLFLACLVLASCRSEQVAFQFQPGTAYAAPLAGKAMPVPASLSANITLAQDSPDAAIPAPDASTASARSPQPLRPTKRLAQWLPPLAQAGAPVLAVRQLARLRRPTTEGVAEAGLGRVALFFIGVTLAVLAGLAALVNVIFGVGFFTALGYTAAGLVVLGLLYLLLSGHKKTTKASK